VEAEGWGLAEAVGSDSVAERDWAAVVVVGLAKAAVVLGSEAVVGSGLGGAATAADSAARCSSPHSTQPHRRRSKHRLHTAADRLRAWSRRVA